MEVSLFDRDYNLNFKKISFACYYIFTALIDIFNDQ